MSHEVQPADIVGSLWRLAAVVVLGPLAIAIAMVAVAIAGPILLAVIIADTLGELAVALVDRMAK